MAKFCIIHILDISTYIRKSLGKLIPHNTNKMLNQFNVY